MSSSLVRKYMDQLNLTLPDSDIEEIAMDLDEIRENQLHSLPMMCEGPLCPFAKTCPLQKKGVAPIGKRCPVEMVLIEDWTQKYAVSLGIDVQNYVELSMLADIIEAEVYDRRTQGDISINKLFELQAVGEDSHGNPIMRREPSVALQVNLMMKKRKDDIRRQFVATREIKAKYKQIEVEDLPTQLARIRAEIEGKRELITGPEESLDIPEANEIQPEE